ncbi:MAG: rod shape-determining protein MreC [Oscillospiraceae bacterium]|nr:rod shape-determining protein MreC [Oscillospiraceae bacterium]
MRKSGTGGTIVILIAALVITVIMAVVTGVTGQPGLLRRGISAALSPVQTLFSSAADRLGTDPATREEVSRLRGEIEKLQLELAQSESDVRAARYALEENQRLRSLLDFAEENSEFDYVDAKIISASPAAWESRLTIDAGTADGVDVNMCVITETGALVGVVTSAGPSSAQVTTILDAQCGVGARVYGRRDSAVTCGDLNLLQQGRLKLEYLQEDTFVKAGDTVLTSGKGGIYPDGLVIGEIETVNPEENGIGLYAVIAPEANVRQLTQVFVITNYEYRD